MDLDEALKRLTEAMGRVKAAQVAIRTRRDYLRAAKHVRI